MDWETSYDKQSKIWKGKVEHLNYGINRSIGDIMYEIMSNNPDHVCQISDDENRALTNQEALTAGIRLAQHFKNWQLTEKQYIGIFARNSTYLMPLTVGCYLNCTPYHAVNTSLDESTAAHVFGLTKPCVIFCDGREYEKICNATKAFCHEIYTMTGHINGVPTIQQLLTATNTEAHYRPQLLKNGGDQTMAVLCSSGTTGLPKAVCVSNRNMVYEHLMNFFNSKEIIFTVSGLDWLSGLILNNASILKCCTRIITSEPYSVELLLKLITKYKISGLFGPPRYIAPLFQYAHATPEHLESVRVLAVGGAPVNDAFLKHAKQLLRNATISIGYGCTETGGATVNYNLQGGNCAGLIAPGYSIRIVNDEGVNLSVQEIGEILINNNRKWAGYCDNAVETSNMQDALGWFHTGDIGYIDDRGYLHVVDRKKDIRKYMGCHFWPSEIEAVVTDMPGVIAASVASIYDVSCNDLAGAVVVKAKDAQLTEQDIVDYVAKRLKAPHKQLHAGVVFVDQLPENNNGKIIRKRVQELLAEKIAI